MKTPFPIKKLQGARTHRGQTCNLQPAACNRSPARFSASAFSLIEIMVTVGLLAFIVLGLLAMYNQVQRAFMSSMTQTDVLEGGRATCDLLQRDLQEMTPAEAAGATNFMAEVIPPALFFQDLPGTVTPPERRTNIFEHCFFLTRDNQRWIGIGYLVSTPTDGVGTLYRFQAETNLAYWPMWPYNSYSNCLPLMSLTAMFQRAAARLYSQGVVTNQLRRVADGVVDFRVSAYSPEGRLLMPTNIVRNTVIFSPVPVPGAYSYYFSSNAVPAYVEFEIGLLEDKALARFRSIPDATARQNYLRARPAQVHLFRERVPIRNVDFAAYQ